jgi:transcriptional regulator with XRE-family HTH domain
MSRKHELPSARAIGKRIRLARWRAGMTAKALGACLGVPGNTVTMYESQGRGMSLERLWRVAVDALDCSLDDLAPTGWPRREHQPVAEFCTRQAIGERLRFLRCMGGLSQRDLAERIGACPAAPADWETGRRNMSARSAWRICRALHVSLEDLLPTGNRPTPFDGEC